MTLQAHASAIYQTIQNKLGTHDATELKIHLERELRHLLPQWTTDRPNCAGWYWYKPQGIGDPQMLSVDHGRIDTKLMADLGPPNNLVDVQRIKGQWAGPLLPPR